MFSSRSARSRLQRLTRKSATLLDEGECAAHATRGAWLTSLKGLLQILNRHDTLPVASPSVLLGR
jgi:hypothetical protein